jgi:hypothetical protein
MARTARLASAGRIRFEDEVWEEAFSSGVPARRRPAGPRSSVAPVRESQPAPESPLPGARRTVRIQGRGADPYRALGADPHRPRAGADPYRPRSGADPYRPRSAERARPAASPIPGRTGSSPDRLAMWATLLGFLLVLVAVLSSHF